MNTSPSRTSTPLTGTSSRHRRSSRFSSGSTTSHLPPIPTSPAVRVGNALQTPHQRTRQQTQRVRRHEQVHRQHCPHSRVQVETPAFLERGNEEPRGVRRIVAHRGVEGEEGLVAWRVAHAVEVGRQRGTEVVVAFLIAGEANGIQFLGGKTRQTIVHRLEV